MGMTATDDLRAMLDERGVEYETEDTQIDSHGTMYYVTYAKRGYGRTWVYEEPSDCDLLVSYAYDLGAEEAIEVTLGRGGYTYEQWREISDAIGDAMEYAHDRAMEHPDKADPLWNLDEYVERVMQAAFGDGAKLGRGDMYTREECEAQFVRGYSLGCLPSGEGWDENERTLEEEMAELGWERERGECHEVSTISHDYGYAPAGVEYETELSCGHRWHSDNGDLPDFCPWCGRKVVDE